MELILNGANNGEENCPGVEVEGRVNVTVTGTRGNFTLKHKDSTLSMSDDHTVMGFFPGYEHDYGQVYGAQTFLECVVDFYARAKELQAAYDAGVAHGRLTTVDEVTGEEQAAPKGWDQVTA